MIPAEYIKTFIPIHELDELKPQSGKIADIHPDDLFLMSQVSAYSTRSSNAVAVSKKIKYKNFSEKLSDDFSIADIKLSVNGKIQPIYDLCAQLNTTSTYLSTNICLSASSLCAMMNNISSNLSSTISTDYARHYGTQTCCLIDHTNVFGNAARFTTSVTLEDGKIIGMTKDDLSNLLMPKDWHIAYGGIGADILTSYSVNVTEIDGMSQIEQTILSDCYVNCMLSAKEDDSYGPLQVWISSNFNTGNSSSALYATLNNPGGFSGKEYFNYYNFSIPIKGLYGSKIILKYVDDKKIKQGSSAQFDCYYYYAVPSKDELSSYAKKSSITASSNVQQVYKITYNEGGIIDSATSVYYGSATNANAGLIKVNKLFATPKYGLRIDNEYGFVEVSSATNASYGTIKYNYSTPTNYNYNNYQQNGVNFLACGLAKNGNDQATTFIPCASNNVFGVVRLNQNAVSATEDLSCPLSSYLGVDNIGRAYVTIPYAHYDEHDNPIPGLIKTGHPDTTEIRVVRNVYLNNKGLACVNVANQIGVGPFADNTTSGYTKCVDIDLSNSIPVSEFHETVKSFNGTSINCSDYGNYAFKAEANVNGWFMAELMYESDGTFSYSTNHLHTLQIICDGIAVTTLNPICIRSAVNKKFIHSVQLGVFKGGAESGSRRIFGAITNASNFGNDKLHFLIKEMSVQ